MGLFCIDRWTLELVKVLVLLNPCSYLPLTCTSPFSLLLPLPNPSFIPPSILTAWSPSLPFASLSSILSTYLPFPVSIHLLSFYLPTFPLSLLLLPLSPPSSLPLSPSGKDIGALISNVGSGAAAAAAATSAAPAGGGGGGEAEEKKEEEKKKEESEEESDDDMGFGEYG